MSNMQRQFQALFRGINVKFSRFYTHVLSQHDLTLPQYSLLALLDSVGQLPMHEVATKLHISRSAITQSVERLVRKKLVRRTEDLKDRRIKKIEVTPAGMNSPGFKLIRTSIELACAPRFFAVRVTTPAAAPEVKGLSSLAVMAASMAAAITVAVSPIATATLVSSPSM